MNQDDHGHLPARQLFCHLNNLVAPQDAQKRPVCALGLHYITGLVGVVADNKVCLILLVKPHNRRGPRGRTSSCQEHYEQQRSRDFHHYAARVAILLPSCLRALLKTPRVLQPWLVVTEHVWPGVSSRHSEPAAPAFTGRFPALARCWLRTGKSRLVVPRPTNEGLRMRVRRKAVQKSDSALQI